MTTPAPKKMPYGALSHFHMIPFPARNSGLKVSRIILGMMSYGDPKWAAWVLPEEEAIKHVKAAYDAGIQTFDTADVYSSGESEIILGKVIKKLNLPRDEIVVMTKLFHAVSKDGSYIVTKELVYDEEGYVNQHGLSRKHIFDSVKHSLKRLQLDYIDVLQCHRFDYHTPIEETMQALHDVVKAGYVRYIGMSSCWAYQFNAMQSSIPWAPLARGLLCRPLSEKTKRGSTDTYQRGLDTSEIINRVEEIAKKRDITMAQVALAWCLAKDGTHPIALRCLSQLSSTSSHFLEPQNKGVSAPIVGTTNLKNLHDLIDAVHAKLTDEEIKYLEEAYKPMAVIGHI
ncbi:hypothetical protein EW146_g7376 [Bondarzewia mesenterica]|uniref:NADP-dependent oxidoreductase domain-containing protein n=1 Tax=Bondarzewia mesenterica TaxID=1095465 RepID=A0A4S4LL39_9AGAM|nr:hypothetical protein EW146_g7376 [Bondarzewia mesenterica]